MASINITISGAWTGATFWRTNRKLLIKKNKETSDSTKAQKRSII
jgi:hypothetical protein